MAQQIGLYGPSGPVQPGWFPAADKVQHGLGFAVPMFLVLMTAQSAADRLGRRLPAALAGSVAAVFAVNAVVSEIVQGRPGTGRTGDPVDALADLVGIGLGWLAFVAVRARIGRRRRPA